jgi:hypothetical protein
MSVINTATKLYVGSNLAAKAYSGTNQVWPPVSALDSSTTAWINAVVAAGGTVSGTPTSGRQKLVNDLIVGLKTDGVWTKLDRLWIFAAENAKSSIIDMVGLASSTPTGTTLNPNNGYFCNTTQYVATTFNLLSSGVKYTQNSAHLAIWITTDGGTTVNTVVTSAGVGTAHIIAKYTDSTCYTRINDSAGAGVTIGDCRGFIVGNRSDATVRQTYFNGASLGSVSVASEPPSNGNLAAWDRMFSALCAGGTLNATEQTKYYNRMRTYMTGVGVP